MKHLLFGLVLFFSVQQGKAQLRWQLVDTAYGPLPAGVHVYRTTDPMDGKPNVAYYLEADLRSPGLSFTVDTAHDRRLTPIQFYKQRELPLAVVNTTFFSYETNRSLNTVIQKGRIVAHNEAVAGRGRDTLLFHHALNSVLGINRRGKADVAWVFTDSAHRKAYALQQAVPAYKDSIGHQSRKSFTQDRTNNFKWQRWKVETAVGGGPVLLQNGAITITNEEERKFTSKALADKHPRTAMGYTAAGKLIILVVQGRFAGLAEGATLGQEAQVLKDLGCVEALNLDGGGSSCLLVNGKETIAPSDKQQRPVPAVFVIRTK